MTPRTLTLGLAALTLVLALASLFWDPAGLLALYRRDPAVAATILVELRLPRTILGLAIGASLGLTGAAMQGLLRNPRASPDVLGRSAGAARGAVVAVYWIGAAGSLGLAAGGITGALVSLAALLLLARGGASAATLVLAGVAIAALAGALTNLALSLAPSPFALYDVLFWLLGSLADRSLVHVAIALPAILLGAALVLASARDLDALALGDEVAASLGVDVARLRRRVVIGTGLAVGGGVAVAGAIGFVGLVVPHLVRISVHHRPAETVPLSGLAGAALLTAADLAVRLPVAGKDLKLGVLTALIGAPFFLWLVVRQREVIGP